MRTQKLLAALLSSAMVLGTMAVPVLADGNEAKIGDTEYTSLETAFAAATDGDTITVLANCAGNGIKAPQGRFNINGLTVDFDNHTYTVDGDTVGSTGTETNGFQLLKDNKITFKNGTITSAKAKILVQNYSNLTLEGMTLTLDNPNYASAYTLSNNNGNVVIDGTTINANPAGGFAFDVCRYSSYPSVHVTVKGNSQINGNVEVSASDSDAKDGFSLNFESGTMTGTVVMDSSAVTAMANAPTKVSVPTAKIGDKFYNTLEEALADAPNGAIVKLINDIDYSTIYTERNARDNDRGYAIDLKDVTLDMNAHTIYSINGTVTFGGSGATIKNGTFDLVEKNTDGSYKDGSYALIIDNAVNSYGSEGVVTVENVTVDGGLNVCNANVTLKDVTAHTTTTKYYAVWAEKEAILTIESGTYTDAQEKGKGVLATGTSGDETGAKIFVKGGTFNASNKLVFNSEDGAIQITGGTFTSDPQAYVAQGYAAVPNGSNYVVNVAPENNTSMLVNATADKPVTIKSAVKDKVYKQVTGTVFTGGELTSKTFKVTATGTDPSDNFTKTVNLSGITGGTHVSGNSGILCGLIIEEIPEGITVTVTVQ